MPTAVCAAQGRTGQIRAGQGRYALLQAGIQLGLAGAQPCLAPQFRTDQVPLQLPRSSPAPAICHCVFEMNYK